MQAAADDLVVNEANSLDELLGNVQQRRVVESREHSAREQRFSREKANQAKMLKDAQAERTREERRSDRLETQFEENEIRIGDLTEQLDKRLGSFAGTFWCAAAGCRGYPRSVRSIADFQPVCRPWGMAGTARQENGHRKPVGDHRGDGRSLV